MTNVAGASVFVDNAGVRIHALDNGCPDEVQPPVLVIPGMPEPHELQSLGVARMTWGSGLATVAYAEAVRVAAAAL